MVKFVDVNYIYIRPKDEGIPVLRRLLPKKDLSDNAIEGIWKEIRAEANEKSALNKLTDIIKKMKESLGNTSKRNKKGGTLDKMGVKKEIIKKAEPREKKPPPKEKKQVAINKIVDVPDEYVKALDKRVAKRRKEEEEKKAKEEAKALERGARAQAQEKARIETARKKAREEYHKNRYVPWMIKKKIDDYEVSTIQTKDAHGQLKLDQYKRPVPKYKKAYWHAYNAAADVANTIQLAPQYTWEAMKAAPGMVWNAAKAGTKAAAKAGVAVGKVAMRALPTVARGAAKAASFAVRYGPQVLGVMNDVNAKKREWNRLLGKQIKKRQVPTTKLNTTNTTADIVNQWGGYRMKEKPAVNNLERVMIDAQMKYKEYVDRTIKANEEYLRQQRERDAKAGQSAPQRVNEFGAPVNDLNIINLERAQYTPINKNEERRDNISRATKKRVLLDRQRDIELSKANNKNMMEQLLKEPDKAFTEAESLIKGIPQNYKDAIDTETASIISHPEEIQYENEKDKYNMENYRLFANYAIGTLTDIAKLANGSGIIQAGVDGITSLLKGKGAEKEDYDYLAHLQEQVGNKQKEYEAFMKKQSEDEKAVEENKQQMEKVLEKPVEAEKFLPAPPPTYDIVLASDGDIKEEERKTPLYTQMEIQRQVIARAEKQKRMLEEKPPEGKHFWNKDKRKWDNNKKKFENEIENAKRQINALSKEAGEKKIPYPEVYTTKDKIKDGIKSITKKGKENAEKIGEAIKEHGPEVVKEVGKGVGKGINVTGKAVGKVTGTVVDGVKTFGKGVVDGFSGKEDTVDNTIKELKDKYGDSLNDMATGVSETVKNLCEIIKIQAQGMTPEDKAKLMYENGEMFEDGFKSSKDTIELTKGDVLKNMRDNENVRNLLKQLNSKDVNVLMRMGVDPRMKNEFVKGEAMKLAHKAFLRKDKDAIARLKALGIDEAEELELREKDLANYLAMSKKDPNQAREMLDTYGLLPKAEYKKKVLDPLNKYMVDHHIDVAKGFFGKALELKDLVWDKKEAKQALLAANFNLFVSQEGTDVKANINRYRNMFIKKMFKSFNESNKANFKESKIRNKAIATLVAMCAKTGFASPEKEEKILEAAHDILHDNKKFILSDSYLKEKGNAEKAFNRIRNFGLFRESYFTVNDIVATQDTFNELDTGNTATNIAMPTIGQKYNNVEELIDKTVGNYNTGDPREVYEANKRKAMLREMFNEKRENTAIILNQIEDPYELSLKELEEINKNASKTNSEQALRNIGSRINDLIKIRTNEENQNVWDTNQLRSRNDREYLNDNKYGERKAKEYAMNVYFDEEANDHEDLLKLTKDDFIIGKPVIKNGKLIFAEQDATGNVIYSYKKDGENYRRIINHLNDMNVRPEAQTTATTVWKANKYNHMYDKSIPPNANELVQKVNETEANFFNREVYDADAKQIHKAPLKDVWQLNEEQIRNKTRELKTSTFEISHDGGINITPPEKKKLELQPSQDVEIKPERPQMAISEGTEVDKPLERPELKIRKGSWSVNVTKKPKPLEIQQSQDAHVSPTKPTLEYQPTEGTYVSPKRKKLTIEHGSPTDKAPNEQRQASNIAIKVAQVVPINIPNYVTSVEPTFTKIRQPKMEIQTTSSVDTTPKRQPQMETYTSSPVNTTPKRQPQMETYTSSPVNTTPKQQPQMETYTSSPVDTTPKQQPQMVTYTSSPTEVKPNKFAGLLKTRKSIKVDATTTPINKDNPQQIQKEVLANNEIKIDETAEVTPRKRSASVSLSPIKGTELFKEKANQFAEKHDKLGRVVGNKVKFDYKIRAQRFAEIYVNDDRKTKDRDLAAHLSRLDKRIDYDKNDDTYVVSRDNKAIQRDMKMNGVESPRRLRKKLKAKIMERKPEIISPISVVAIDSPIGYTESQTLRLTQEPEQTTFETATGTTLTPAIIPPPPLNQEEQGGEEDDE